MFDHLDDPMPFIPDEEFRRGVEHRSRRLRARHRLSRAVTVIAVFALVAAGGSIYVLRRDAAIDRVDVSTQPSTDGATNVLIVGPDLSGVNADSITILRLEESGRLRVLSIPRDLWDEQAQTRINATYGNGVQALLDSIHRVTGVPIDHYVELSFAGFIDLVDELGGLPIAVQQPIRDAPTGLQLDSSTCTTVDGETLLALVRARHVEYQDPDGAWRPDPTADLGRIARSQALMAIALEELANADTDPGALDRYSRILADHARLDSGLSLSRLAGLARQIAASGPARSADTLPVEPATSRQGASVLHLAAGSNELLKAYGSDRATVPPGTTNEAASERAIPIAHC